MRLLLAVAVTFLAGAAWAGDGIVPETDKPDVVYIGEGWAPSLKDGCLDRGAIKCLQDAHLRFDSSSRTMSGWPAITVK